MPDWKKEVSFGRKKSGGHEAKEPKQSIWKKELGGKKQPKAEVSADAVPFWKKELGKPKAPKLAKSDKQPKAAKAPKPAGDVPFWKKELGGKKKQQPAAVAETAAPVAVAAPEPPAAPAAVAQPIAPVEDFSWLTNTLDTYAPAPEPATPAQVETTAAWPPPSEAPPARPAWPPPSQGAAPVPTPPAAVTPAPVAAVVPAEPAPVIASPLPQAAAEPKVPFWKKELGAKKKLAPAAAVAEAVTEVKAPFWKKELGKPKGEKPAKAEKSESDVPFWKRELGKPKGEKADKPPKAEKVESDAPFWKRELGGKSAGKAKPPKAGRAVVPKPSQKKEGTIVGLKIGASQIAAAKVDNGGAPQLLQVAREPLDDGIVVGGELRDVEALAEALKKFFAKHKLPKKGIRLGIANNRIGVRAFEISGIDDPKQLANAIRFRAQETLPIPLEEAVLDWQVLSEHFDENGVSTRRVLLVVAYRELVDRYVNACKKAGLRLDGIDLEAFAMLRALTVPTAEDEAPPGAQVVVNVGHDRSTFAVSDGRVCEFTRVLAWGGQHLDVALARGLDITPSEASPIKHVMSLVDDSVAIETFTPDRAQAVCAAARAELQIFARELVSSLRFYQSQPSSLGISEVVLSGGTVALPGLSAELERLIGVVVRVGDPTSRVRIGKRVVDDSPSLAIAIGLGIED